MAARWELPPFRRGERARVTEGVVAGIPVRVLKPTTYMNRSGAALASLRADPTFDPARDLLVLVDDWAIPCGTFRLRADGSSGGQKGLKSIEGALQSQQYARLRVGIGPKPDDVPGEDFVLGAFLSEEDEQLEALLPQMVDAVDQWLRKGSTG